MTNLTINKEVRNGIEYWVSNDASQVGMSLSGVTTMSGWDLGNISRLISAYTNMQKLPTEQLEALRGQGFQICDVPNGSGKPVKFIPAEVAAAIIEFLALDNKRVSEDVRKVALQNFRAIASVGMKMFILNQVGYKVTSPEQQDISGMLATILKEMTEMKQLTARYVSIKENTRSRPGLDEILNNYEQGYLISDGEYFTLGTWLTAKGLTLTQGQKVSLGMAVHATFKTHGRQVAPIYGGVRMYSIEDVPLLEAALKNI